VRLAGSVFFILLVFSTGLVAQVKIQERVRISPLASPRVSGFTTNTATYYLPCGPRPPADTSGLTMTRVDFYGNSSNVWAAVYSPGQFPYTIRVDFIRGTEYVRVINRIMDQNVGYHFTERYNYFGTSEFDMFFDQLAPEDSAIVTYRLTPVEPGSYPIEISHIVVLPHHTLIARPLPALFLYPGEELFIDVYAINECGWAYGAGVAFPASTTYNVQIVSGQQYGTLADTLTGASGSALTGVSHVEGLLTSLKFLANGEVPESTVQATIRFSTSDTSIEPIEVGLLVLPPPSSGCFDVPVPTISGRSPQGIDAPPLDTIDYGGRVEMRIGVDCVFPARPLNDPPKPRRPGNPRTTIQTESIALVRVVTDEFDEFAIPEPRQRDASDALRGVFVRTSGDTVGPSAGQLSMTVAGGEVFYYVANGVAPEAGAVDVRFRFRLLTTPPEFRDGGTARVLIRAQRPSLDHFSVTLTPDTIAFTETSRIFVRAKDADSQDVEFDTTALLMLSVTAKEEYGTFIDKNGDTLKTTPVRLDNIPYGDARGGEIRFAAVKKNPDSLVVSRIRVELQSDPSKNGEKDIVVVEQTLKIVMVAPYEVVPTKLLGNRNQQAAVQNRKPFSVQLTRNRRPVPSHAFVLTTNYVDGTGGHDHIDPRRPSDDRTQRRENFGYFILQRTAGIVDRPYQGATQTNGRENLDYVASMFGDSMLIVVESADSLKRPFLRDSITIAEILPDLQLLGGGGYYDLIGGTCNHHGPGGDGICANPNNNHWATVEVIRNIQNIAASYRQQFLTEQRLHINDMSLPFGGRFDKDAQWEGYAGHQYHRQGTDVDIRSTTIPDDDRYRDVNRNGRYDQGEPITFDLNGNRLYDYTNTAFEEICRRNNVLEPRLERPGVPGEEHYHLYFYLYD